MSAEAISQKDFYDYLEGGYEIKASFAEHQYYILVLQRGTEVAIARVEKNGFEFGFTVDAIKDVN